MTLYCGLSQMLLFDSLQQHFECPLSTSVDVNIANGFSEGGIMLQVKRANSKTRYLDVSWLSVHDDENERLIMGSSLQICDIYIQVKSNKSFISAIQMLEHIITGRFVTSSIETESDLFTLISSYSLLSDSDTLESKYTKTLFQTMMNRMNEMQYDNNRLWINTSAIQQIKHIKLREWIDNKLTNHVGDIHFAQLFEWKIYGDQYKQFLNMSPRKYITSKQYEYNIDDEKNMLFHLRCCTNYSDESKKCALFLCLNSFPIHVESIRIEYDLICDKKPMYRNHMEPQWISKTKPYCGFKTFSSKNLRLNDYIRWQLAVKILQTVSFDINAFDLDSHVHSDDPYVLQLNNELNILKQELKVKTDKIKHLEWKNKTMRQNIVFKHHKVDLLEQQVAQLSSSSSHFRNASAPFISIGISKNRVEKKSQDEMQLSNTDNFIKIMKPIVLKLNPNVEVHQFENIVMTHKLNGNIFIKTQSEFINSVKFAKLFASIDGMTKKQWGKVYRKIKNTN
eukprot:133359_1